MTLQPPSASRRLPTVPAPSLRRRGRLADWLLSVVFASLLGAAVWKLDHGVAPDATPAPVAVTAPNVADRVAALARDLLGALIVHDERTQGLSASQSAPEGWPMWGGPLQTDRAGPPRCLPADGPRDRAGLAATCD